MCRDGALFHLRIPVHHQRYLNWRLCLPAASEGDLIVFTRTGAYSVYEGMSLFLTHELPGVVLYSEKEGLAEVRKQLQTHPLNTPMRSN